MDYLDWQSDLSLEHVFAGTSAFSHPSILDRDSILYLTKHKDDNRSVLVLHDKEGGRCVTPAPFNLITKVNEYGGKPYWVFGSSVVFVNGADQCLYRQEFSGTGLSPPMRISRQPDRENRFMYTDVHLLGEARFIAIIEQENLQGSHANNLMFIGAIGQDPEDKPLCLLQGADFFNNLVINRAGTKVAWVQWDHPSMPWDATELWTADIVWNGSNPALRNQRQILDDWQRDDKASVCQLVFANNDRLFYSADYHIEEESSLSANNFWNLHCYDFDAQKVTQLSGDTYEYGYPHWVYGDHRIAQISPTKLVAIASEPTGDHLVLVDQDSLEYSQLVIDSSARTIQHLDADQLGNCVMLSLPFDKSPSVIKLELGDSNEIHAPTLLGNASINIETSVASAIEFTTRDGQLAHGFYYPPINSEYFQQTLKTALPPLLVMVHGGPTARAYGHFDLQKQFWTSRGFAILDVNHRGSSGYGRQFRDALYGRWGEIDASDIADGVDYLIAQKKVDANRVCIRGKSAGGYAVLRALTEYPSMFRVGACYYGIGNLVTLAETTHKFEKHYTDRLVDEVFDAQLARTAQSNFYQRSPINKMSQLNSAMIVFQGGSDRVVPPSVAQEIIGVLVEAGIDHQYVEYANEGHGFKLPENNIDAWTKELEFYRRVLRC